jgi:competence protein ComEA helix-hairpin-helix repeat region
MSQKLVKIQAQKILIALLIRSLVKSQQPLEKININQADLIELQKLTGVGQKKAQDIIDFRTKNGDFKSLEDLGKVSGFGDKTLEKIER